MQTKRVVLFPPLSQSIKSQRAWPSGVLGEQEQRLVGFYYCVSV